VVLFLSCPVLCCSGCVFVCVTCFSSYTSPSHLPCTLRIHRVDTFLLLVFMALANRNRWYLPSYSHTPFTSSIHTSYAHFVCTPRIHTSHAHLVFTPSSVVKCLWGVFVWGFGVLFLSCVYRGCCSLSMCVCRGCCSLSMCVCV